MSNYRKTMGQALQEMYPINEDNIDLMRKAAAGAAQTVKMKDGKLKMDMFTASAIMQILDKVNPANKKKMTDMINKGTKGGMMKLQDFAMKQVKSENDPAIEEEVDLDEFTKKDFDSNEDQNMHTENAVELARKFGSKKEYDQMVAIYKAHMKKGSIERPDQMKRDALVKKYLPKLKEEVDLDEAPTPGYTRARGSGKNIDPKTAKIIAKMISGDKLTFNFDYGLTTDRINDIKKQGGNPPKGVGPDGGGSLEALMRGLGDTDNDIYLDGPDLVGGDNNTIGKWKGLTIGNMLKKAKIRYEEVDLDEKKKGTAHASLKDVMALDKKNAADKKQAKKDKKRDDANRKSNRAAGMEEVDLDEFTVSDVEIAMKKKYGKVDKEAIEKLKKVQHMGNVDRNALVKVGHGKLHVESVDLDEAVLEQLAKIKGNSPADKGRKAAVEDDIERAEKKGDKKEVEKLKEADLDEADDFKPHMMYDPKTGKGYKADTMDDHLRMKKMGYTHDAPKKEEVDLDEANFEIKNGKIHISKADYAKKPKEYKGKRGGKPTLMALDPKTGSTTSFEVVLEEVDLDEASARSDAMKAMRKGKSVDPADIDNTATDDDVRGASKNIIMQLRKAGNRASMGVEFGDGKKVQISPKMAIAVQQKYNAMKKPADKEKFQARIAKSYKDMLSALKEELQPKKESILERMNRKIKENKNG
jgi:hypothetical protein